MTDYAQIATIEEELEWEEWKGDIPFWRHAVAGSTAGIMEHVAMYPLDTVKTRMQAYTGTGPALGIRQSVRAILNESGPLGLIRGWNVIASGCIPAHIALFTVYEAMREKLSSGNGSELLASHHAALCGIAATAAHDCILTPMDVIKQRLQLGCYQGAIDCTRQVIRTEGLRALFRSYPTTLAINAPYGAVLVAVNEKMKSYLIPVSDSKTDRSYLLPRYFLSAGIGAACASVLTHPLDVIKTRLQTQDCFCKDPPPGCPRRPAAALPSPPRYTDFFSSVKLIHAEEGLRGLYRGLLPRAALSIPGAAMCWGTYESVKNLLNRVETPPVV